MRVNEKMEITFGKGWKMCWRRSERERECINERERERERVCVRKLYASDGGYSSSSSSST